MDNPATVENPAAKAKPATVEDVAAVANPAVAENPAAVADPAAAEKLAGVRRLLAEPSADVLLAIAGLLITQLQPTRLLSGPQDFAVELALIVAVAPAFIAIRRIEPVLALGGLLIGAMAWSLLDLPGWVALAGCALAIWSLPRFYGPLVVSAVTMVAAGLPLVTVDRAALWIDSSAIVYGSWPRWQSVALLLTGLVSLLVWWRNGRGAPRATVLERLQSLRTLLLGLDRPLLTDGLMATTIASVALLEIGRHQLDGSWSLVSGWMPYAIAGTALTLTLRRRQPEVPVILLALGNLLAYWANQECWTLLAAFALALYSVAGRPRLRRGLLTATIVLTALPVLAALIRYPEMVVIFPALGSQTLEFTMDGDGVLHNVAYETMVDRQWPLSLSLILVLAVFAGLLVRLYRRNRETAAREVELERRAVEQEAAQAVLTERSHIARDLHDVVAHAVNLMVIQAETGPDLVARGDQDVLAGFQRIGDAGRRALGELDRMLSALRDADGVPDPALTPQPGLADLDRLVADVAHDGLVIELDQGRDLDRTTTGHQLTAYRLVQEALTNVVRHAGATKVTVMVDARVDELVVEVRDDGHGFDPEVAQNRGRHGLAGMRERVRIHRGSLTVDSAPGRGTTIIARIPLTGGR